ncbi:MAG: 50S ribosomal protein L9 [Phycisphaerales bacterium]|nr:50S ribosomal protein L9 [Phycisphaerales bacterium]
MGNIESTKKVELLLNETIEHLGIVGDVVSVKPGYARNYLLPLGIAEVPTEEKVEALKELRKTAKAQLEALRAQRVETIDNLESITVKLTRSCNDQGVLYGSVTQRDISDALLEGEMQVDERAVRLNQPIRHVGNYTVLIQFEKDLRSEITIEVLPDRTIEELDDDMEFDDEGELIEKPNKKAAPAPESTTESEESAPTDDEA